MIVQTQKEKIMLSIVSALLKPFAAKYIWWKTADEAVLQPERVIAQVMELGDFNDVQKLLKLVGEKAFCEVIIHAEAGLFSPKSWYYWHYRLGFCKLEDIMPEMPKRKIA